jgi:hypothetical protein
MSIDEEEIKQYLEGKSMKKNIQLSDNANDYDQGGAAKEAKIGTKSSLARAEYLTQRDTKMRFGDKEAINEFMTEQTQIRQNLEQRRERQLLEYQLLQEEKARLKKESKITQEDRESEKEDIVKLERKKDKEVANLQDYFNSSDEFWEEYQKNGHVAYESPAGALITQADNGTWACDIHRYEKVLESPTNDGRLVASSFTIDKIENHFRKDPKPHLAALIEITNNKYSKLIEARKEQTLEDKDVAFKKEIRQIEKIKTRPGGDYGLLNSGTKMTKGQKARIREAEQEENERNRQIYRGLY